LFADTVRPGARKRWLMRVGLAMLQRRRIFPLRLADLLKRIFVMISRPLLSVAMLALAGLAACAPGMPRAVQQAAPVAPLTPKDSLVAAIEANGCVLTAQNVGAILLRANLTQNDLLVLTPELAAEGRVEVAQSGVIRVLTENCI
jgi:hypothetical protein